MVRYRESAMAITMQQVFNPWRVTSFLIGLGIYRLEKSRSHLFFILYFLIMWITYCCLFYYIIIFFNIEEWFFNGVTLLNLQFGVLTTLVSIILSLCYDKKFRKFMKRLAAVDDTLEELGTPKSYRKLCTRLKGVIIAWIIYSCIANINDMIWWMQVVNDSRIMIAPYIINHYRHVNVFVDLSFIIFLWYIGTRFDKVNEHVRYLSVKEEHGLRCTGRKAVLTTHRYIMYTDNYKRVLWISMHLHLELCQIAGELNSMFEVQVTLEMTCYLLFMIGVFYFLYLITITKMPYIYSLCTWINIYFWALTFLARLFCLNYFCENISTKAKEINGIIHQLTEPPRYSDICDEIYQFTLQVLQRPLKMTGMGFFILGNSFMRKFFATVVTFVIIIVQTQPSTLYAMSDIWHLQEDNCSITQNVTSSTCTL